MPAEGGGDREGLASSDALMTGSGGEGPAQAPAGGPQAYVCGEGFGPQYGASFTFQSPIPNGGPLTVSAPPLALIPMQPTQPTPSPIPSTSRVAPTKQPTNGEEEAVPKALSTAALRGRLELEGAMRIGGIRLLAFLLLYVTMLNAYTAVTPNDSLFEVNAFLEKVLDRESLSGTYGLEGVKDALVGVSANSKRLMPMSSDSLIDAVPGDLEIVSQVRAFSEQELLQLPPGSRVRVDGPEWTLSAWVRLDRGNIIKQVSGTSQLTCWAWEVESEMQLRFGGHDSQAETIIKGVPINERRAAKPKITGGEASSGGSASGAGAGGGGGGNLGNLQHVAVVVKQGGSASFFRNGVLNSSVPLPRDITSCIGAIALADPAVTMASLKFHARALSDREVEDMFKNGKLLVEVATGKSPMVVEGTPLSYTEATEEFAGLDMVLQQNVLQLSDFQAADKRRFWANQALPVLQGPVQAVQAVDATNGAYTSIVENPVQVNSFVAVDVSTLPELRADESITLVFWTRMENEGRVFYWYLDAFQPVIHAWIQPSWTNIRWPNGPGATSGMTGIDFGKSGVDTTYEGPAWRLTVMVWDASTKSMRHYLDGQLLYDTADYPPADGLPRIDAVLPRGADEVAGIGQGGYVGGVAQMRMYKSVWTVDMIKQYQTSAEASGVKLRECKLPAEYADDTSWSDAFGHGCSWFSLAQQKKPETRPCDQVAASTACPVACNSVTPCWQGRPGAQVSRWQLESPRKRLQHLGPSGTNTSICTGKSVDRAAVLEACRALPSEQRYLPKSLSNPWLYSLYGSGTLEAGQATAEYQRAHPKSLLPANLTDCDELDLAWSNCEWDDSAAAALDAALLAEEEFIISFWFKDVDALDDPPIFRFFSSLAPVSLEMQFGRMETSNYFVDIFNAASQAHFYSAVDSRFYKPGKWNSVTMGWQKNGDAKYSVELLLNGAPGYKLDSFAANTRTRFASISAAFSAEGNIVISPIEIHVGNWPLSDRQRKNYQELLQYTDDFQGPFLSEQQRTAAQPLEREQMPASNKPILLAPPIMVQWRDKSAVCEGFGATVMERQIELANNQCTGNYQCFKAGAKLERPEQVRACSGEPQDNSSHFGLAKRNFHGDVVYSDFLSSLDAPVVVRDGVTAAATDVLDLRTREVLVLMAVYTPEIPAASVLSIDIEFEGVVPDLTWDVRHLSITTGKDLIDTRMAFAGVYICHAFAFAVTFVIGAWTWYHLGDFILGDGEGNPVHGFSRRKQFILCTIDLTLLLVTLIICSIRHWRIESSFSDVDSSMGSMAKLKWEDQAVPLEEKLDNFFAATTKTEQKLASQAVEDMVSFIVLIIIMVRLIVATAVHPRVGLLPSSLAYGWDDLAHFFFIFLLLYFLFALLGTWVLGSTRSEFVDFTTSCATQFNMMIGELPEDWSQNTSLLIFVSVHFLVFFFFLLNFLLAIIVEAYMQTRALIEHISYERYFFSDLILCFYHPFLGQRVGWPSSYELLKWLPRVGEALDAKPIVTTQDLRGMFRDDNALKLFLATYGDMCAVPEIDYKSPEGKIERLHEKMDALTAQIRGRGPTLG